jgi:cysteine-rich repeat protein
MRMFTCDRMCALLAAPLFGLVWQVALVRAEPGQPVVEGFEEAFPPTAWARQNLSSAGGFNPNWEAYETDAIEAHGGAKYAMADYGSAGPGGVISNWLFSPEVTIANGVEMSFWTFSTGGGTYADRLEVRVSTAGDSVDVGADASSVGDFATTLLTINEALEIGGYPDVWTQYTVTVDGLAAAGTGRFAFRYVMPDSDNAAAVTLDDVEITTLCGNGTLDDGEACDDGNLTDDDGCDSNCTATGCGNGVVTGDEACDDGNTDDGDGCDDGCQLEGAATCGDGVIEGDEECDDDNTDDGDGCSRACRIDVGYACTGEPSSCAPICGDARIVSDEECDDGNQISDDGCSSQCAVEAGWDCEGSSNSSCTGEGWSPSCGNCSSTAWRDRPGARGALVVIVGLVGLDVVRRTRRRRRG